MALSLSLQSGDPISHENVERIEVRAPTRAGHVLAGTFSIPTGLRRGPVAVFVSGAGPQTRNYSTVDGVNNRAFEKIENGLLRIGIASFRYDEVGTGLSGGSYREYATSTTLADDLADVLTTLRSHQKFEATEFLLIGHSEGGLIASMAAVSSNRIAGLVLLAAPATPGSQVMQDQWAAFQRLGGETTEEQQSIHRERLRLDPWYRLFLTLDPSPIYARVVQPVLLLQGEQDYSVPAWHADRIASVLRENGNTRVKLVRLPERGHAFINLDPNEFDPAVTALIVDWAAAIVRTRPDKHVSGPRTPAG
ncbi:MAG: alpha/beta hydrolase [Gemmatimonadaceae bacterium]|nr:alpha/beta hydrolase [Gemmatimonadaceae bacterium]